MVGAGQDGLEYAEHSGDLLELGQLARLEGTDSSLRMNTLGLGEGSEAT